MWSRTSSRAGLPCCPLRGTGQDSPCTGRAAPGPWAGDGLCEPRQGAELGTGSRCWQEQPHTAEARAGRDRELLPQMLGRGIWAPPCCPCGSHTFPQQLSPGSFPSLSRAPVLIPRGLGCALPCSSQSPGKEGQAPSFHRSLCVPPPLAGALWHFTAIPCCLCCPCSHHWVFWASARVWGWQVPVQAGTLWILLWRCVWGSRMPKSSQGPFS